MANETRHAAWQTERHFAVRLLPEEGEPTELADGLGDFLEAVDFAVEWLAREDPERTGTASLAIFETSSGGSEKVWAYPPDESADESSPLMKIFGFDPVNWKAASSEYSPKEPALGTFFTRAPESMTAAVAAARVAPVAPPPAPAPVPAPAPQPAVVAPAVPEPRPVPVAAPQPAVVARGPEPPGAGRAPQPAVAFAAHYEEPGEPSHSPLRPRRALAAAWHDVVARSLLILAGISLWLAVAFSDAEILVFVLLALSGLWWRRDKLIAEAKTDVEDWL